MQTKSFSTFAVLFLFSWFALAAEQHPRFEPKDPKAKASALVNLLQNAKISASGHWDKQKPELAFDGDKSSPSNHWACEKLPVWIEADMGSAKTVSAIQVWPYWGDGRIYKYKVEGSTDGKTWKLLGDMTANSITASPEGNRFTFDPQPVRYVKTTVLENSRGAATGGHIVEIAAYENSVADVYLAVGDAYKRFDKTNLPVKTELKPIILNGWRGERVSGQVLICAGADVEQARIKLEPVNEIPNFRGSANFLRYTQGGSQLWADIIDPIPVLSIPAGTLRPVWFNIDIPQDYTGKTLNAKLTVGTEKTTLSADIQVNIVPAVLPPPSQWKIHLDLWQQPDAIARWHDVERWSPEHFALMKPVMQRLADAGQKAITCAIINEGWNEQTYDTYSSMVEWIKKSDGTWQYDYTHFDQWITFMMEIGIKDQINCYTMVPWDLRFRYFDEKSNAFVTLKLQPGSPEYEAHWGPFLKDLAAHVEKKGWTKQTRIAMDERPDHLMRPAMALIEKYAPSLKIALAVNAPTKLTKDVDDLSMIINHSNTVTDVLAERHKKGFKTTIYVCCGPARPNNFMQSNLAEGVWQMHISAAAGFDGFLRWAYQSWIENPLVSTDYVRWPSGDCFLVYPGNRGAVRFESMRDGIEDFEKINILRAAAEKSDDPKIKATVKALNDDLSKRYTWERGKNPIDYDADVKKTETLINHAATLIFQK